LGLFVSLIPQLLLLLWAFLDRSPERHPKKRPIAVGVGVAALVLAIIFGLLGHFSERDITFRGRPYHIDIYGVPHRSTENGPPSASK
jgi:quinol-cytochrome oxidoreductase complex cytochrome b subunit